MKLSPHFTLEEAIASATARRMHLDNMPPPTILPRLEFVAQTILEPVRAQFGRPIIYDGSLSWYRSAAVNAACGGVAHSQHVKGEAVDIEIAGISNIDIAHYVAVNVSFDQLILENWDGVNPSSGWVHVSAVADRYQRRQILTYSHGQITAGLPR